MLSKINFQNNNLMKETKQFHRLYYNHNMRILKLTPF